MINKAVFFARFKVGYVKDGQYRMWDPGAKAINWKGNVSIPEGSKYIKLYIEAKTLTGWKEVYRNEIFKSGCYKVYGSLIKSGVNNDCN